MKKSLKIILIIVATIIILIGIDIGSILLRDKPIFAIKQDCDCLDQVYYGLLYNTYNCWEQESAQIKGKWTKFSCTKSVSNTLIYGEITGLKDNYIVIKSLNSNSHININDEAHVSLINNPEIMGANNLIIGQYIKVTPKQVQETYPIMVITDKIKIQN